MFSLRGVDRGVVFPSPVVLLSILAITMAAVAFVATRNDGPAIREIDTVARPAASSDPAPASAEPGPAEPAAPLVKRGKVYVEIFNNSGITGLAGETAEKATGAGWNVVGSDNWVGTVPGSTVYYPPRLKQAGKLLARDLGIDRLKPAVPPMRLDRLTVILTDDRS
jgi:LytR cell envelope-related transcriptional attenuator